MTLLFFILIVLASALLGIIVLIQNPKGGGLTGNVAGFGNQFMGVKQTTDVLEKGTWLFAVVIGLLCVLSTLFMGGGKSDSLLDKVNTGAAPQQKTAPAPTPAPAPATTTPAAPATTTPAQ